MDSGATHHFTLDINVLDTMTPFSGSEQVTIGNGKQLCISHLGTAKLPSSYSPPVLHQGQLDNGLYKVQSSCSPSAVSFPPQVFIANIKDPNLWHKRLGHPALSVVNQILDSFPLFILLPPLSPSPLISSSIPHSFPSSSSTSSTCSPLVAPTSLPSSSHSVSPSIPPPSPPSPSVDLLVPCSLTKPTSFLQAIKDPSWKQSMEFEFATLQHNKTWHLVPSPSSGELDVHNAFLHGDLAKDVFMEQLPGFVDPLYPTHNDSSLFFCHSSHGLLLVLVYVDDIIVIGSHSPQVHHTPTGIHLSQAKYITDLLTRAAMLDAKPCPTPMSSNTYLSFHDGVALENGSDYRSFVGALYLPMTSTSLAIQMLTGLPALMTSVAPVATASFLPLIWFLGHLPNKKVVSRSSAESEYRGVANGAAEIAWTESLLCELSITPPPLILCDNISATYLAANPILHAHTKHVEIDYHFVTERVLQCSLFVQFTPSDDQLADCMTKPLSTQRFITLRSKLTVLTRPMSLRGDVKPKDVIS
ncbi:Retrovirus-related Pol polyprotein from transposon RE1 [Vitis vinifera]|uniref:Retrovirus-related Pol polyprotein from transposon RE1 n=1 Tax=Vitis vinifera TaxID=29760 RepID=A0A438HQS6_VITVI|nr:Retrovirus-related Pol polyprotein from transposon RE1 [Vitis vinifera]